MRHYSAMTVDNTIMVKFNAIQAYFDAHLFSCFSLFQWSYGVTIWELFTNGSSPYPAIGNLSVLQECLEAGYRLSKPDKIPTELWVSHYCLNLSDLFDHLSYPTDIALQLIFKLLKTYHSICQWLHICHNRAFQIVDINNGNQFMEINDVYSHNYSWQRFMSSIVLFEWLDITPYSAWVYLF